jgi:beta-lactamase superfamily II metal-dependent hydrolase
VLTHSHGDHFGAFISFTAKHAADVTVENFVLNTGTSTCYTGGHDSTLESIGAYAKTYYGGAKVHQPHIGQRLYFCDVEMEILYTHEMFHFSGSNLTNENSASLVTRLWIDGVSILLTADAADNTNLAMARLYGDYLKSDFFQIPHHGNGGGANRKAYWKVKPKVILWTAIKARVEKDRTDRFDFNHYFTDPETARANGVSVYRAEDNVQIFNYSDGKLSVEEYDNITEYLNS